MVGSVDKGPDMPPVDLSLRGWAGRCTVAHREFPGTRDCDFLLLTEASGWFPQVLSTWVGYS